MRGSLPLWVPDFVRLFSWCSLPCNLMEGRFGDEPTAVAPQHHPMQRITHIPGREVGVQQKGPHPPSLGHACINTSKVRP